MKKNSKKKEKEFFIEISQSRKIFGRIYPDF